MTENRDQKDREIVRRVLAGDRNEFRRLVEAYQPVVTAIGRRTIRVSEELDDYVQDVFLKAFVNLRQFRGSGRFYSWLMRIAYTTALNRIQRAAPEVPTDPELLGQLWYAPQELSPDRIALRRVVVDAVTQAIRDLPGHFAWAVELFFFMKLRYREIADMTGLPVNTLKSLVFRARRRLRESLGPTFVEDWNDV